MNMNQIHTFLAVAEHENISKAAEDLFIAQPAVSRQIIALEKELQVKLFVHRGRNIFLTDAGKELLSIVKQFDASLSEFLETYKNYDFLPSKELCIGYVYNWNLIEKTGDIISTFANKYPHIQLTFKPSGFQELVSGVRHGQFDGIITMNEVGLPLADCTTYGLTKIQSVLLYSKKHPAYHEDSPIQIEDFKSSIVYHLPSVEVTNMEKMLNQLFHAVGFTPKLKQENSWQTCLAHVYKGEGVLLTDEWAPEPNLPQYESIKFPQQYQVIFAKKNKNHDPALESLFEILKETISV